MHIFINILKLDILKSHVFILTFYRRYSIITKRAYVTYYFIFYLKEVGEVILYYHITDKKEVCLVATKKVSKVVKLQLAAGKATPAPPVGPSLGQTGINIQQFCVQFNDRTKEMAGNIIPAVITVYEDRSFSFITKTPPASDLLKKAAGIKRGSGVPHKDKVGTVTKEQVREIAKTKMADLNAYDEESAMKIVEGTAKNMGIVVEK